MASRKSDFTLPTLDDLFSSEEERQEQKLAKIRDIPIELIDDFPEHPFKVRDDEDMMQLVESILPFLWRFQMQGYILLMWQALDLQITEKQNTFH